MGYFDGLTAASFKTDAQGRELFFFWGKFGKGRVIPTPAQGTAARNYLKVFYVCLLIAIVPIALYAGEAFSPQWLTVMGLAFAAAFAGLAPLWLRTRAWPLSDERITIRESVTASAKGHGTISLVVLTILAAVMVLGSLFVLLYTDGTVVGLLGVLFFGAALIVVLFMLRTRKQT